MTPGSRDPGSFHVLAHRFDLFDPGGYQGPLEPHLIGYRHRFEPKSDRLLHNGLAFAVVNQPDPPTVYPCLPVSDDWIGWSQGLSDTGSDEERHFRDKR